MQKKTDFYVLSKDAPPGIPLVYLMDKPSDDQAKLTDLRTEYLTYAKKAYGKNQSFFLFPQYSQNGEKQSRALLCIDSEEKLGKFERLEFIRKKASELLEYAVKEAWTTLHLVDIRKKNDQEVDVFLEAVRLSAYRFRKYKTNKKNDIKQISIDSDFLNSEKILRLNTLGDTISLIKDWVNEPFSGLNVAKFCESISEQASKRKLTCTVLGMEEIKKAKMGGLLGVNQGSVDEAAFLILEHKPEGALNKKPMVFIGKGVLYDSGGMNIKIGDYMDNMKSDMAGAAVVAGLALNAAACDLKLHIVALLPLTDNRLNGNALVSGDIIKMSNGKTVEIVNTDAEGRLILADAVSYAEQFDPSLICTVATLTGAASRALGSYGIPVMQQGADEFVPELLSAGERTYERLCFFPMWNEYEDSLKSNIADIKNCGPSAAGMITAAKFLKYFTQRPFVHFDIAGPAFALKKKAYVSQGATAFGFRILWDFLTEKTK